MRLTFRSGNTAASLKHPGPNSGVCSNYPFRSGNTAASLKPQTPRIKSNAINFPQWKHCGLIEASWSKLWGLLKLSFPQWKHCGLIEAPDAKDKEQCD